MLQTTNCIEKFSIKDQVAIITGGAGLLGMNHAVAIASAGGNPVIVDIENERANQVANRLYELFNKKPLVIPADITNREAWQNIQQSVLKEYNRIDILVNNAANNPKMEDDSTQNFTRFESFQLSQWEADFSVGLTGAFLGCQVIGSYMAEQGKGVIVNIASDLAVIAPDQRLYRQDGIPDNQQNVKPVTYSVIKHGIIGLTKYLATYWAEAGIRVNALSPAGVFNNQPEEFVEKLSSYIPLGRMAKQDEYQAALIFLCSNASSYMTGHNLIVDGGRSIW